MIARLKKDYRERVVPEMQKQFGYKNVMEVPQLKKIVLNMGLGAAILEAKLIETATKELARISGQKPVVTKAKKAISNFKLRKGLPIGASVILRKNRMYEFFDRLCNVALPRVRDFKGVPAKSFDGSGNYTLGIKEHTIFPEVDLDKVEKVVGFNATFVTDAKTDKEARALLKLLGMPFRQN